MMRKLGYVKIVCPIKIVLSWMVAPMTISGYTLEVLPCNPRIGRPENRWSIDENNPRQESNLPATYHRKMLL